MFSSNRHCRPRPKRAPPVYQHTGRDRERACRRGHPGARLFVLLRGFLGGRGICFEEREISMSIGFWNLHIAFEQNNGECKIA